MAIYESVHPVGQDMEKIQGALLLGLADSGRALPDNLALNYEDAFTSGLGVSTLRVANWATKNQIAMYFPLAVPEDDPTWLVECEDGHTPIKQRVIIEDMLGRGFGLRFGGIKDLSAYLQFDIIKDGIVLSAKPGEQTITAYGEFESEAYDALSASVRITGGIAELAEISVNI